MFSQSNTIGHILGMVDPVDVKWKGSAAIWCSAKYVTLKFDLFDMSI